MGFGLRPRGLSRVEILWPEVHDSRRVQTGQRELANGKDKSISVIDANSNKLINTIALAGTPETAVVDGKGRLYIAIEDQNAIAVIDTDTMKLLHQYDISAVCDEPAGLAIDSSSLTLFAGCHNRKMAVVDGLTGKVLAAATIGQGTDATAFDPERKLAFASNGDGSLTVVAGTAPYRTLQTLATMPRARTMVLDPVSHALYLVSAEAVAEAPQSAKARPALKAGTFTLLTVSPQ
jgi:DNA-binding beta-propeller fold protein YncE